MASTIDVKKKQDLKKWLEMPYTWRGFWKGKSYNGKM